MRSPPRRSRLQSLGISFLSLFYLGAGAALGDLLYQLGRGRMEQVLADPVDLLGGFAANAVLLTCLWLLWRKRTTDPEILASSLWERAVQSGTASLPVNHRVAFLLFAACWVIGVFVPIVFAV